ncbi:hypothetical protein YQE_01878, partial [Dendroctonus ponderosae]
MKNMFYMYNCQLLNSYSRTHAKSPNIFNIGRLTDSDHKRKLMCDSYTPVPGRKVLATIRDCASSTEHDLLRMVSVELKTPAKFMLKYLDIIQFLNIFTVDLFITFASINYLMSKVNIPVHHEMLDLEIKAVLKKRMYEKHAFGNKTKTKKRFICYGSQNIYARMLMLMLEELICNKSTGSSEICSWLSRLLPSSSLSSIFSCVSSVIKFPDKIAQKKLLKFIVAYHHRTIDYYIEYYYKLHKLLALCPVQDFDRNMDLL